MEDKKMDEGKRKAKDEKDTRTDRESKSKEKMGIVGTWKIRKTGNGDTKAKMKNP